jgi:hypothetical protein
MFNKQYSKIQHSIYAPLGDGGSIFKYSTPNSPLPVCQQAGFGEGLGVR